MKNKRRTVFLPCIEIETIAWRVRTNYNKKRKGIKSDDSQTYDNDKPKAGKTAAYVSISDDDEGDSEEVRKYKMKKREQMEAKPKQEEKNNMEIEQLELSDDDDERTKKKKAETPLLLFATNKKFVAYNGIYNCSRK